MTTTAEFERIRIDDADWETYERFLAAIGERRLRCTYDRGRLEIMAPLRIHEREKRFLSSMVERIAAVLRLPFEPCGSMTIRRVDLDRGFEPDECFYLANAPKMLENREPDFTSDPPPDLAIEVDITSSSIDRQSLYASLRIPELWRLEDGEIVILLLRDEDYVRSEVSDCFKFLTASDINRFLELVGAAWHLEILEQFELWLRQTTKAT